MYSTSCNLLPSLPTVLEIQSVPGEKTEQNHGAWNDNRNILR